MAPDLGRGQQFFSLSLEKVRESVPFLRPLTLEALPISCRLQSLWLPGSSHWGHQTNKKGPSKHLPANLSHCWRVGETAQANKGRPVGSRVRGTHRGIVTSALPLLTLLSPPLQVLLCPGHPYNIKPSFHFPIHTHKITYFSDNGLFQSPMDWETHRSSPKTWKLPHKNSSTWRNLLSLRNQ